jgi:hypothetical protein
MRAGIEVRLAEPAETRMRQERKRRRATDKLDARLLRELWAAVADELSAVNTR